MSREVVIDVSGRVSNPFGFGYTRNSSTIGGPGNRSYSENSSSVGNDNKSGVKGWYFSRIDEVEDYETRIIYLSNTQSYPSGQHMEDFDSGICIGDVLTIFNGKEYKDCCTVIGVDGNAITVNALPFEEVEIPVDAYIFDYAVYCYNKRWNGGVDFGKNASAEGSGCDAVFENSHAEGAGTKAYLHSHAEGVETKAGKVGSHAEGKDSVADAAYSHAEGLSTSAIGNCSHSEGQGTISSGECSHAEGLDSKATNNDAHAEGYNTTASGKNSHSEGSGSVASGNSSHSEGIGTVASGNYGSHAEGESCQSLGRGSHAEGRESVASGGSAHAEGYRTLANGGYGSHSEGYKTIAKNDSEHACGAYNVSHDEGSQGDTTIFSIGIGSGENNRKNALEVTRNGNVYVIGIGGYDGKNISEAESLQEVLNRIINN